MRWLQAILFAALAALATAEGDEAALATLAASRAAVQAVDGEGLRTVVRLDEPDEPAEARRVRFAVAAGGRYDVVIDDPVDPEGERTRFVSDGTSAWELSQMAVDDPPVVKRRPARDQDLLHRLLACLRLDLPVLRRDYAVILLPGEGVAAELRLTPTDPAVAAEVVAVSVRLEAGVPVLVVLDDTSGNRHRLVISAFRDDPGLAPDRFAPP